MPEQKGNVEVLKSVSTESLLQELNVRLASSKDARGQVLITAIDDYVKAIREDSVLTERAPDQVMQTSLPQTELNHPEDEFVQAVKAVTVFGKFPQGLNINGKVLVPPTEKWEKDFGFFSPTSFSLHQYGQMTHAQLIQRCLFAIDSNRSSSAYPQAADLMKKHFLAITPSYDDPNRNEAYKEGYCLLIYGTQQDTRLGDSGHRHVRAAEVVFLMPKDKAIDFVQLVEEKSNGADIVEQFIQKAAPGVMASDKDQSGVHRVQSSELVILDTKFIEEFLTARDRELLQERNFPLIERRFLESVNKAVVKPYSQPIGFGKPNS